MSRSPLATLPPLPSFAALRRRSAAGGSLPVTARLERYVRQRYSASLHEQVLDTLRSIDLDESTAARTDRIERIQTAAVFTSRGFLSVLLGQAELARIDWRDVLVNGGLADDDWSEELDAVLGPLP